MSNSTEERRTRIQKIIETRGGMSVGEIQDMFDVSRTTIYRDLITLHEKGVIKKVHGGIFSPKQVYNLELSLEENVEEKKSLARKALDFINNEDTIFLGPGTTTLEIAKIILTSDMELTIVTNSIPIACIFNQMPNIRLIVLGGDLHFENRSLVGPITISSMKGLIGHTLFFGANAVDITYGATSYHNLQVEVLKSMIECCRTSILVADSSKFGNIHVQSICKLEDVDAIITDHNLDPKFIEPMSQMHVNIWIGNERLQTIY
jgi:DeoR family transcriptional regulator, fructose operon transcriptional repressor